jgi:succinate dehydrogenase/fumarate reductase iron-sulfur protein
MSRKKTAAKKGKSATQSRSAFAPENKEQIHVHVFRFNPVMDFSPRRHMYSMDARAGESVWEMLLRIKHHHDGSLALRGNCGNGVCGGCGVKVNGKPMLGCITQVKDHADAQGNIHVEPLDEQHVKKDLAQDEAPFFAQFLEVKPWMELRANEHVRKHRMLLKDVEWLGKAQECNMCQLCNVNAYADLSKEIGPAAFVKGFRYLRDVRDGDVSRAELLKTHLPVHYPLEMANLCPRDILPGEKIEWIKKQKPVQEKKPIQSKQKK